MRSQTRVEQARLVFGIIVEREARSTTNPLPSRRRLRISSAVIANEWKRKIFPFHRDRFGTALFGESNGCFEFTPCLIGER
jgi:hypothetical protein